MRKLSFEEMENVKGGRTSACFTAMYAFTATLIAYNGSVLGLAASTVAYVAMGDACGAFEN